MLLEANSCANSGVRLRRSAKLHGEDRVPVEGRIQVAYWPSQLEARPCSNDPPAVIHHAIHNAPALCFVPTFDVPPQHTPRSTKKNTSLPCWKKDQRLSYGPRRMVLLAKEVGF